MECKNSEINRLEGVTSYWCNFANTFFFLEVGSVTIK